MGASNLYSNQVSFGIAYSGLNNVATNLTYFNTSNTTYNIHIQKQVQDAYFKYMASDVLASSIQASKDVRGGAISSDASGNVYFTGTYSSPTSVALKNIDNTSNTSYTLPSTSSLGMFITRYNSSGTLTGATRIDGATTRCRGAICTDANGYIYAAGDYTGTGSTSNINGTYSPLGLATASVGSAFVTKYGSDGTLVGTGSIISPSTSTSFGVYADGASNLYAVGCYNSSNSQNIGLYNLDGSPSAKTLTSTSNPSTNSFIIRYSSNGDVVATASIVGMDPDSTSISYGGSYARAVCGDVHSSTYVVLVIIATGPYQM